MEYGPYHKRGAKLPIKLFGKKCHKQWMCPEACQGKLSETVTTKRFDPSY